jgi:small subunit ribosomal protein S6
LLWIKTGLYQPKGGIMRRYETIIIIDPDLSAEQREPVLKRVKDVIEQQGGYSAFTDAWGVRKLAYEIKKKERGYYVRFDFCGTGTVVDEMERFFRIDDRVLKYMTVLLDKVADIEKIKEEVAAAESKAAVPEEHEELPETQTLEEPAQPSEIETPEEPTKSSEIETPEQQAELPETQTLEEPAQPSEIETPEEPTKSSEIETPEQQAELAETQPPEPEATGADTTPNETEEEIK